MKFIMQIEPYDHKEWGRPWIGKIADWPDDHAPVLEWGRFVGAPWNGGHLEMEADINDVFMYGQKEPQELHQDQEGIRSR